MNWWRIGCDSAIVFGEYDAINQCGYALITVEQPEAPLLEAEFPRLIQSLVIDEGEEQWLIDKW